MKPENQGMLYGLLGVAAFSLTLPMTRLAVEDLSPVTVGLGRCVVAAGLALGMLLLTRPVRPRRQQLPGLLVVALGVVIGFPLLSAWALQQVPASHGAIVVGLLPLATAIAGVVRAGERPAPRFWLFSLGGTGLVVGYVLWAGGGRVQLADFLLLGAVVAAALGYAEGGRLAREMGGWQVICWALLLAAPLVTGPVLWSCWQQGMHASPKAWAGFAYVSAVSMFLGFFAWYKGLALGGIARVGQVQLLQPFLTLTASAALLGERLSVGTLVVSVLVVGVVAAGRQASSSAPEARRPRAQPQPSSEP